MMDEKKMYCGLSLKHATIITGIIQSIFAFIFLVLSAAYAENPHELLVMNDPAIVPDTTVLRSILITIAVGSALHCIFSILLIFGAETNRPKLLVPWLILTPICICTYIICTLIAIAHHSTENRAVFISSHLIIASSLSLIGVYKYYAVLKCYAHLKSLNF